MLGLSGTVKPFFTQFFASMRSNVRVAIALMWTIHGIEIQLVCYIINSQIMEKKNCSLT